jgi:hypothetical protein
MPKTDIGLTPYLAAQMRICFKKTAQRNKSSDARNISVEDMMLFNIYHTCVNFLAKHQIDFSHPIEQKQIQQENDTVNDLITEHKNANRNMRFIKKINSSTFKFKKNTNLNVLKENRKVLLQFGVFLLKSGSDKTGIMTYYHLRLLINEDIITALFEKLRFEILENLNSYICINRQLSSIFSNKGDIKATALILQTEQFLKSLSIESVYEFYKIQKKIVLPDMRSVSDAIKKIDQHIGSCQSKTLSFGESKRKRDNREPEINIRKKTTVR